MDTDELLEEVEDIFPDGSEFQVEPDGRYHSIYITVPENRIAPLRPEDVLRRRGFDVYAGGGERNSFYVHQIK